RRLPPHARAVTGERPVRRPLRGRAGRPARRLGGGLPRRLHARAAARVEARHRLGRRRLPRRRRRRARLLRAVLAASAPLSVLRTLYPPSRPEEETSVR